MHEIWKCNIINNLLGGRKIKSWNKYIPRMGHLENSMGHVEPGVMNFVKSLECMVLNGVEKDSRPIGRSGAWWISPKSHVQKIKSMFYAQEHNTLFIEI